MKYMIWISVTQQVLSKTQPVKAAPQKLCSFGVLKIKRNIT
jgi:hypothetical protein